MSKSKRTVEERIAELNKREQDMLEKAAKQVGIEFGRRELIEKMLMNHETMDKIKEYTGYTQEKIDEIAKELSAR